MKRESFADPITDKMLNKAFICIKVEREERPNIDSVYMKMCQIIRGISARIIIFKDS